jgi:hypothetical protein
MFVMTESAMSDVVVVVVATRSVTLESSIAIGKSIGTTTDTVPIERICTTTRIHVCRCGNVIDGCC